MNLEALRKVQESLLDIEGGKSSPSIPSEVSEGVKVVSEGSTSDSIKSEIEKTSSDCSNIDSDIEKLMEKMLLGTVELNDVFGLLELEIRWRLLNNLSPKFANESKLWVRLRDKVKDLKKTHIK